VFAGDARLLLLIGFFHLVEIALEFDSLTSGIDARNRREFGTVDDDPFSADQATFPSKSDKFGTRGNNRISVKVSSY
jgi:hypothetical protein